MCVPRDQFRDVFSYSPFRSPLSTQHLGERAKSGWLEMRIMCACGTTCLSTDCRCSYGSNETHGEMKDEKNTIRSE
jgi:hypothetical protein